jgi:hypothetical protein
VGINHNLINLMSKILFLDPIIVPELGPKISDLLVTTMARLKEARIEAAQDAAAEADADSETDPDLYHEHRKVVINNNVRHRGSGKGDGAGGGSGYFSGECRRYKI